MRIAVFVGQFPSLSETFIVHQLVGLVANGHELDIYARLRGDEQQAQPDVVAYDLLNRVRSGAPMAASYLDRLKQGTRLFRRHVWTAPSPVMNCLNVFRFGRAAASGMLLHKAAPLLEAACPEYDLIHAHFADMGSLALQLRQAGAIAGPILTSFHGFDVTGGDPDTLAKSYRQLFTCGEHFTANTNYTGARATALGCPSGRIDVLPMGLDVSQYPYHQRRISAGEVVRVLSVGRLVEKKGIHIGVRAIGELAARGQPIRYDIVGDGPLRSGLEQLVDELGLRECVHLWGGRTADDVRRFYREAHLFMLPSMTASNGDMEGQGLVVQEAQACGLPVVATRHNGVPEGVLEGRSADLVPEGDVAALAGAVKTLAEAPDRWPAMGRAGRELVEQHYERDKCNQRLMRIYEGVAEQKAGSP